VIQVIGPVLDIQFEQGHLPDDLQTPVRITSDGFNLPEPLDVTPKCSSTWRGAVRTVAWSQPKAWMRGM